MNPLLLPELRELLSDHDSTALVEVLRLLHPARIAEFSEGLSPEETWRLLQAAPADRQADIFSYFPPEKQEQLVSDGGREPMSKLIEAMSHDDRADLLKRLDEGVVESLLPLVSQASREDIRRLMSFPADTAGAVMTTDYATLSPEMTVAAALATLRLQAANSETIFYLYVIDQQRHLVGVLTLRDLVLAHPDSRVETIMRPDVISVPADRDQEMVAHDLAKYNFFAIPVVDDQNRLIGIITHDDIADVLKEEATEDFHLAAAVAPLARGYRQTTIAALYGRRVGWLVILVFVNLVSSGVIAAYEETLQAMITLAFFLPLLIDSGGNTGSQAATLIVRALATGEVRLRDWWRTLLKEMAVGISLGLTMALASFALGVFRGGLGVGLIVGLSMLAIVVLTNLVGVIIPFVLTRVRLDPAVASSPLITTVADAAGLMIYFSIANLILSILDTSS